MGIAHTELGSLLQAPHAAEVHKFPLCVVPAYVNAPHTLHPTPYTPHPSPHTLPRNVCLDQPAAWDQIAWFSEAGKT